MKKHDHLVLGVLAVALMLVTGISTRSAPAAEEPKSDQLAQEPTVKASEMPAVKVGANRELVFKDGDPEFKFVMYFDPNRDLPRQRFAAQVLLTFYYPRLRTSIPKDVIGEQQSYYGAAPRQIAELLELSVGGPSQADWFRARIKAMRDDSRPAVDLVEDLASNQGDWTTSIAVSHHSQGNSTASPERPRDFLTLRITVVSEDKERLEALVRAVILVIDEGFSVSCHKSYVAMEQRLREWNEKCNRRLREGDVSDAAMQKELGELSSYDNLTTDALGTLIAHKRIIGVDLAGIEARLNACARILAAIGSDPKMNAKREQVETVKITAEIELSGLTAKRKALDEIITAGQRRFELIQEIDSFKRDFHELQHAQKSVVSTLDDYRKAITGNCAYAKVPPVRISPIRWLPATKDHPAGAVGYGHFEQEEDTPRQSRLP